MTTKVVKHDTKKGKLRMYAVNKATGAKTGDVQSKQVPVDPFGNQYSDRGLRRPPFDMDQLVWLAEMHPLHSACLEQRASDVVGGGWVWKPLKEDGTQSLEQKVELQEKFLSLGGPTSTTLEILHHAWLDFEAVGMGYLEVGRTATGEVGQLFHVPGHTVRVHTDGLRYVQIRNGKRAWFTAWNSGVFCDAKTGKLQNERTDASGAELMVFKKPTRRSAFYGIPTYVSAIGWIMLALEARDYNIKFFQNLREPRWAIILSNLEGDDAVQTELEEAFALDLQEPHKNLIAAFEGDAKIDFQKMSEDQNDMGFSHLLDKCDEAILAAHRMPSDRIGLTKHGPLGGSVAEAANNVYREGVVLPHQEVLNHRLNQFILKELEATEWQISLVELDTKAEKMDLEGGIKGFRSGIMTVDEARQRAGLPPVGGTEGEQFIWMLDPEHGRAVKSYEGAEAAVAQNLLMERLATNIEAMDHRFGKGLESIQNEQHASAAKNAKTSKGDDRVGT